MIYSASLSLPVKRAFGDMAMQSTVAKILSQINEDPEITTMDTVVLGPKDGAGPKGKQLAKALPNAHPNICFIYIYHKSSEESIFDCPNKTLMKKATPASVKDTVEEFLKDHVIKSGNARVSSADFDEPDGDNLLYNLGSQPEEGLIPDFMHTDPMQFSTPSELGTEDDTPVLNFDDGIPSTIPMPDLDIPDTPELDRKPLSSVNTPVEPTTASLNRMTSDDVINHVNSVSDWEMFKQLLNRESIFRDLINQNSEFQGLINIIDTLDYSIQAVWRDTALSHEQKFDKIKQIGLDRSVAMATANSITANKVIDVITKITLAAKRTVESKLESYDMAMFKVASCKMETMDTSQIDHAIQERAQVQFELLALSRKIVDLYNSMDLLVTEEIKNLDAKLPSSSDFINNMVRPIGTQIFTPTNTEELVNRMTKALQENRITASQLENLVNAMISTMFELFSKDTEIINYQQNLINMLRAHHVEDVVIVDSVIKNMLRIYTGADNTGRSATAITWCGILSRRQNCLLIDLTGRAKFKEYGIESVTLEDFMKSRIKKTFLCVEASSIPGPDELQDIIDEVKTRLDYYPYVNLIMDPDDNVGIEQASVDAKTIYYITNCTDTSMSTVRNTIANHSYENIARQLIMIDPPISPLTLCDVMGIDPSLFKLVIIPNMVDIRACALQHDRPYEFEQVVRVFEEAFK